MFGEDFWIAEDDQAVFGTGEGNVQSTWVAQEANALMIVRANAGKHNKVFLSSLEGVDGGNFNLFVRLFLECAVGLHRADDIAALTFVGCDDTDFLRLDTSFEE